MPAAARRSSSCSAALRLKASSRIPPGFHPARHKLDDTADQRLGLARSGRREDARRPGSVLHGGALRGIEALASFGRNASGRGAGRGHRPCRGAGASGEGECGSGWRRTPAGEERADVLQVQGGAVARRQRTWSEDVGGERPGDAIRCATRDQRVDELEQDAGRLGAQFVFIVAPQPETGTPPSRTRRRRPRALVREAHAGMCRGKERLHLPAPLDAEELQAGAGPALGAAASARG